MSEATPSDTGSYKFYLSGENDVGLCVCQTVFIEMNRTRILVFFIFLPAKQKWFLEQSPKA